MNPSRMAKPVTPEVHKAMSSNRMNQGLVLAARFADILALNALNPTFFQRPSDPLRTGRGALRHSEAALEGVYRNCRVTFFSNCLRGGLRVRASRL